MDKFITELKSLVKTCSYNNDSERIHDKIVCCVKSAIIRKKLLAKGDGLILERAITICHACETTQVQLKMFEEKQETKQEVDPVSRNWKRSAFKTPECYFCGWQYARNHSTSAPKGHDDVVGGIGMLSGYCKIHLKDNATTRVHSARKVPRVMKDKLRNELVHLKQLGIVEKVIEHTKWVNAMAIVEKKDESIHLCINPVIQQSN
ncbi:hypothetical protein QYM36_006073 [Artemia franciscana]|uniref:Uncharacterized protein n=1 Tax=Artemia franciscana TaxID=6661 RepID=A0AA88I064_ARTSF|nr:hypothetical protein QYM36_006073 [Artemia franciscana]